MEIILILLLMILAFALSGMFGSKSYAHGYVESPPSRAYRYSNRRGTGNPSMIGNVANEPQSLGSPSINWPTDPRTPQDGKLASANCAVWTPQGCPQPIDRQTSTLWDKTTVSAGAPLDITWFNTAPHRSLNWRYYITKPDWDPNSPLTRAQFDLTPIANYPGNGSNPVRVTHSVNIPSNRSGYHVIYAIWDRDPKDNTESFYQVIDINIVGGGGGGGGGQGPSPEPEVNTPIFNNQIINLATALNGTSLIEPSGSNIVLWSPRGTESQNWQFILDPTTDTYTIRNIGNGLYLTETSNNATLTSNVTSGSRWKVYPNNNNTYQIVNSATNRSLDVTGGTTAANGTQVITWSRTGNANQLWYFKTATTSPPTPEQVGPTNFHSMGATSNSVNLMWTPAPGATTHTIYRGESPNNMSIVGSTGTNGSFIDTSVQPGSIYYYQVRASNPSGQTFVPSDTISVVVPPITTQPPTEPPTECIVNPPTNLRVTGQTQTSISLAWNAPTSGFNPSHYDIYRDGVKIAEVSGNNLSYTDTGLNPGTSHMYSIRAFASLTSDLSNSATGTTTGGNVTQPSGTFTYRVVNTGGGNRNIVITNNTSMTLQSGWPLQFNFFGFTPTVHSPAVMVTGSNGSLNTNVNQTLGSNQSVTIPVTASGSGATITSLSVNGQPATLE